MASELRTPWICKYLIDIGEDHGAFLSEVKKHARGKRAQLVEFLTYEQSTKDSCIWMVLSDKWNTVPARITDKALESYKNVSLHGKRLTEQRNAIVIIKEFSPFFGRVPLGGGKGLTQNARLALDVDFVQVVGGAGESTCGNPKDVVEDEKVRRWSEGLLQDGGGGNVLKIEKEQANAENRQQNPEKDTRAKISLDSLLKRKHVSPKKSESRNTITTEGRSSACHKIMDISILQQYKRSWKSLEKVINTEQEWAWCFVPDDVKIALKTPISMPKTSNDEANPKCPGNEENVEVIDPQSEETIAGPPLVRTSSPKYRHPLDLGSSPPSSQPKTTPATPKLGPSLPRPTTPSRSEWSPSVHGSPRHSATNKAPSEADEASDGGSNEDSNSGELDREDSKLGYGLSSSPVVPKQEQVEDRLLTQLGSQTLAAKPDQPVSQLSPGSQANFRHRHEASSPLTALPTSLRKHVARKVPYPVPPNPRDPDASGPERILVPNSDPSGSGSGSLGYSQSQSQSQGAQALQANILAGLDRSQHMKDAQSHHVNQASVTKSAIVEDQEQSYEGDRSSPEVSGNEQRFLQRPRSEQKNSVSAHSLRVSVDDALPDKTLWIQAQSLRPVVNQLSLSQTRVRPTESVSSHRDQEVHGYDDLSPDDQETLARVDKTSQSRLSEKPGSHSLSGQHLLSPPTSGSTVARTRRKHIPIEASSSTSGLRRSSDAPILPSSPDVFIDARKLPAGQTREPSQARKSSHAYRSVRGNEAPPVQSSLETVSSKLRVGSVERSQVPPNNTLPHDPYAWALPSFMRKGKERAIDISPTPANKKRKRVSVESITEETCPAVKLQKVSNDRKVPSMPKKAEQPQSTQTRALRRQPAGAASALLVNAHGDADKQQSRREVTVPIRKSSAEIKVTRPAPSSPGNVDQQSQARPSGIRVQNPTPVVPPRNSTGDWERHHVQQTKSSASISHQPKLAGFTVDFDLRREESGPPLITWQTLTDILLQTGRIRNAAMRK
ncbi:hypothetical protein NEOLEDRAFT_1181111 [Neolentinus lepideus HHB14362 ss-1]|uniref:Shelterin complex subunit TPP1/Est3 domain-containing protein n=1 Tax=Neolentinus lepideus HHB14362 ss-1 TaxID=1314782 RepID=A0A165QCH4_9AGAM|nr:hypothetical protein NEOLEDRAFT_1181111 [Neolentinus lepideus HHB14362 ss-1]